MKNQSPIEILNHKILLYQPKGLLNYVILVGQLLFKHQEKHIAELLIMLHLKYYKEKAMTCLLMFGV